MSKKFLNGALVILAGVLVAGYFFLKQRGYLSGDNVYYGRFETVSGLSEGSPVKLKGVVVGRVEDIELEEKGKVLITLSIPERYVLQEGTVAQLVSAGLTEGRLIELHPGAGAPLRTRSVLRTKRDTTILEDFTGQIAPLLEEGKYMLRATDSALTAFNLLLNTGLGTRSLHAVIRVDSTLKDYAHLSAGFNDRSIEISRRIRSISHSLAAIAAGNRSRDSGFPALDKKARDAAQKELDRNVSELHELIGRYHAGIKRLNDSTAAGPGSLGALDASLDTLERNMGRLRDNPPGITVFGSGKK